VATAVSGKPYRAILFDLFGTLVSFASPPAVAAAPGGVAHRHLSAAVEKELPGVGLDTFLEEVRAVSREIHEARRETHVECSSAERFRRVLLRLGVDDPGKGERLCRAHMRGLSAVAQMPTRHREILQFLTPRFRLGLVSNFDHAPTAHAVLGRFGLAEWLDAVVISEEFGLRKPRPEIFARALDGLGVSATETLFVGDTPLDDVHGARSAGIDAAWLNPHGAEYPADLALPVMILPDLETLLARL
jgi:FMN phosphatase YigB (HAD superfamily)